MDSYFTYAELQNKAIALINAMIFAGPENEQALHLLLVLLAPEVNDDLPQAVLDADTMIAEFLSGLQNIIDDNE